MGIKIKNKDPRSTDFNISDVIININGGTIFYKDNDNNLFKLQGDNINTPDVTEFLADNFIKGNLLISGNISSSGNVTSSGNISSSGIVYGDTGSFNRLDINSDIHASSLYVTASGQSVIQVGNTGNTLSKWEFIRNGTRRWAFYNDGRTSAIVPQDSFVFKHGTDSDGNEYINMSLAPSDQGVWCHGHITASGTISGSNGNILGFNSASLNYITASSIDVNADSIRFGGEEMNKILLQNVKDGFASDTRASGGAKFTGNITASGDISSSGIITGTINGGSF